MGGEGVVQVRVLYTIKNQERNPAPALLTTSRAKLALPQYPRSPVVDLSIKHSLDTGFKSELGIVDLASWLDKLGLILSQSCDPEMIPGCRLTIPTPMT